MTSPDHGHHGTAAGKVDWAKSVTERAAASGLARDAEGNLIETSA